MPSENRNISDLTRSFLFQKGIIETVPWRENSPIANSARHCSLIVRIDLHIISASNALHKPFAEKSRNVCSSTGTNNHFFHAPFFRVFPESSVQSAVLFLVLKQFSSNKKSDPIKIGSSFTEQDFFVKVKSSIQFNSIIINSDYFTSVALK